MPQAAVETVGLITARKREIGHFKSSSPRHPAGTGLGAVRDMNSLCCVLCGEAYILHVFVRGSVRHRPQPRAGLKYLIDGVWVWHPGLRIECYGLGAEAHQITADQRAAFFPSWRECWR